MTVLLTYLTRFVNMLGKRTHDRGCVEIKPRNLEVHWPEGNCLLSPDEIDIASGEPDCNAIVRVEKVGEAVAETGASRVRAAEQP